MTSMYQTSNEGIEKIRMDLLRQTSLNNLECVASENPLGRTRSLDPNLTCEIHGTTPYAHGFCTWCELNNYSEER